MISKQRYKEFLFIFLLQSCILCFSQSSSSSLSSSHHFNEIHKGMQQEHAFNYDGEEKEVGKNDDRFHRILASSEIVNNIRSERDALIDFYESLSGDQWANNENWGTSAQICEWFGITCQSSSKDNDSGVIGIRLSHNLLAGSVPHHIWFNLPFLQTIDLSGNSVIDAGFVGLTYATALIREKEQQQPQIQQLPTQNAFVNIVKAPLRNIVLSHCLLQSIDGLQDASETVEMLFLNNNRLRGVFPMDITKLTMLKELSIMSNAVSGTIPIEIGNLQKLVHFSAYGNPISGTLPSEFGLLDKLNDLILSNTNIEGTIPASFNSMLNLQTLHLSKSSNSELIKNDESDKSGMLTGPIPSFANLPWLSVIDFSNNLLSGSIPTNFLQHNQNSNGAIGSADSIATTNSGITKPSYNNDDRNHDMIMIVLANNMITGAIPKSLSRFQSMNIFLSGNRISGQIPSALCHNYQWMSGLVEKYHCKAILCPVGTYNKWGRRTLEGQCLDCNGNKQQYLGAMSCDNDSDGQDSVPNPSGNGVSLDKSQYPGKDDVTASNKLNTQWQVLYQFYAALDGTSWDNSGGWDTIDTLLTENPNMKMINIDPKQLKVCTWDGIRCDENGHVQSIQLQDNRLYGIVPADLFNAEKGLPYLSYLDLSGNRITIDEKGLHTIRVTNQLSTLILSHTDTNNLSGLRGATQIQILLLDGNDFRNRKNDGGSAIPTEIFTLKNLRILKMEHSNIEGILSPQLGLLSNLQRLDLRYNLITGTIPNEIGLLTELVKLDMSYNLFSGNIPETINSLTSLETLKLDLATQEDGINANSIYYQNSGNEDKIIGLSGPLPSFWGLPMLKELILDYNHFSGIIPARFLESVSDKDKMKMKIGLSYNELEGAVPAQLNDFQYLDISLEGNTFTDLPRRFCDNIQWMDGEVGLDIMQNGIGSNDLSSNDLIGDGCSAIMCPPYTYNDYGKAKPSLDLYCKECRVDKNAPALYGQTVCSDDRKINDDPEKKILDLLYASTGGDYWTLPHQNWTLPSVSKCNREGIECNSKGQIIALRLNQYGLKGTIPTEIYQLKGNRLLGFTDNLVDMDFNGLGQSVSLEVLQVSNTKVRNLDGIVSNIPNKLREIHLARNSITGTIPQGLFSIASVEKLFLSSNKFEGPLVIPVGGGSSSLKILDISDNLLTAHIPTEIASLIPFLERIDLSLNYLSGILPKELGLLTNLIDINLSNQRSNNKLAGQIFSFKSNPKIRRLNLSMNNLEGTIPSTLLYGLDNKDTEDIKIDLSFNKLIGTIPIALGEFNKLNIEIAGNRITGIPQALCTIDGWMGGLVGSLKEQTQNDGISNPIATLYGKSNPCDAILCQPGTSALRGRQTDTNNQCSTCATGETAVFYGSTGCKVDDTIEREILSNLYTQLNGTSWLSKTNWVALDDELGTNNGNINIDGGIINMDGGGICTWYGVECNENYHVTGVDLSNNNIVSNSNNIDTVMKLFSMPFLKSLDLKGNFISLDFTKTPLPSSSQLTSLRVSDTGLLSLDGIRNLPNLSILHATNNGIKGSLPDDLFTLTKLRSLYLSFNQFDSTIPTSIGNLIDLEELYIFANILSGAIPVQFRKLSSLRELVLASNKISGTIPGDTFNNMQKLEQLSLFDQKGLHAISGELPTFENTISIWYFDVSNNQIEGSIPLNFMSNSIYKENTVTVNIQNNDISGTIPESLNTFQMMDLAVADNKIVAIDVSLCEKENWMKGDVGNVGNCDAILCPVGTYNPSGGRSRNSSDPCLPCPYLQNVAFLGHTSCANIGAEEDTLNLLYKMTGGDYWTNNMNLNWNLGSKSGTKKVPLCSWEGIKCADGSLNDNSGVTSVTLIGQNLTGTLPPAIWTLPKLREVNLLGNEFLHINLRIGLDRAASSLQKLVLSNTRLTSLEGIGEATSLQQLQIVDTGMSGTLPMNDLLKLSASLLSFHLSNNFFNGRLPTEIGLLTELQEFHASDNEFYSTIPTEIGRLSNLRSLGLSENLFYGQMPTELSNIPRLDNLQIYREQKSGPKLSGTLPAFDKSPALTMLMLSGNRIQGTIPDNFLSASPYIFFVDLHNNTIRGSVPKTLTSIESIDLRLEGNEISYLPSDLCKNDNWMEGMVGVLKSCDAILCPPKTANIFGRAKGMDQNTTCQKCQSPHAAPYYGSTECMPIYNEREILMMLYDACDGDSWHRRDFWNTNTDVCDWYGIGCKNGNVALINLGANNLRGIPPVELFDIRHLEVLWLHSNPVQFSFYKIGNAKNLLDLRLDETMLNSLEGLNTAKSLTSFNGRFNRLQGNFPADELFGLTNIRTLNLGNNKFSGPLPQSSYEKWRFLRTLRLGSNSLSGSLPSFFDANVLMTLDLSDNAFDGTIPKTLLESVNTGRTTTIDLSTNFLVGNVPKELNRFEQLNIYVKNNQIEGLSENLCNSNSGSQTLKWNGGDVGKYGCDAILCKPGTANIDGRQSSRSSECVPCEEAPERYGQTSCPGKYGIYDVAREASSSTHARKTDKSWLSTLIMISGSIIIFYAFSS